MGVGNRLTELREFKDLTRENLADILKVSYSTISKYETDKRAPDSEMLKKIADFFDVSVDYLLGRTDIKNTKQTQVKDPTLEKIEELSEESKKELDKYLELLKIKDQVNKSKDEISSALENEA